jgi:hypothetical protein
MNNEPWILKVCLCGSAKCRGKIVQFLDLPSEVIQFYARLGVIPEHV